MAARGAKPKSAHLRLIEGTHRKTRHGSDREAREAVERAIAAFGPLRKPDGLTGDAWGRFIAPAFWLDGSREPAAIAFCELWREFVSNPARFPASRHSQMRAYMADLGLTDERNRTVGREHDDDEFFDD